MNKPRLQFLEQHLQDTVLQISEVWTPTVRIKSYNEVTFIDTNNLHNSIDIFSDTKQLTSMLS